MKEIDLITVGIAMAIIVIVLVMGIASFVQDIISYSDIML